MKRRKNVRKSAFFREKIKMITKFQPWDFLQSGSKAKDGEKERKRERRAKVGNNNGQLYIATQPRVAHAKPPGPKSFCSHC